MVKRMLRRENKSSWLKTKSQSKEINLGLDKLLGISTVVRSASMLTGIKIKRLVFVLCPEIRGGLILEIRGARLVDVVGARRRISCSEVRIQNTIRMRKKSRAKNQRICFYS